jgi:hypothetical protein
MTRRAMEEQWWWSRPQCGVCDGRASDSRQRRTSPRVVRMDSLSSLSQAVVMVVMATVVLSKAAVGHPSRRMQAVSPIHLSIAQPAHVLHAAEGAQPEGATLATSIGSSALHPQQQGRPCVKLSTSCSAPSRFRAG